MLSELPPISVLRKAYYLYTNYWIIKLYVKNFQDRLE